MLITWFGLAGNCECSSIRPLLSSELFMWWKHSYGGRREERKLVIKNNHRLLWFFLSSCVYKPQTWITLYFPLFFLILLFILDPSFIRLHQSILQFGATSLWSRHISNSSVSQFYLFPMNIPTCVNLLILVPLPNIHNPCDSSNLW